jgi:hypothetical protein
VSTWGWDRVAEPAELARYVHQDLTRKLLPAELARDLPGPGAQAPAEKARLIFEVFARRGVRYVKEPSTSVPGRQRIRPVDQVLARPRQATCVDMCVAYAGACLDAGLHPMIVVLDSRRGGPGHAIVLVWLDGSWPAPTHDYPLEGVVHEDLPVTGEGFALPGEVRASVEGSGAFLTVDVTGATWPPGASGPAKDWPSAVRDGAVMLTVAGSETGAWQWAVGIDVGIARHTMPAWDLADWRAPSFEPLTPAYTQPNPEAGPLTQIKARQGVVPFHTRDELDLLLEWAQATSSAPDGVELAVVYGVGGAGKTHLAAEVCRRLDSTGWYTGFLAKHPVPDQADLDWLSGVVSPVLVVIDYVEDTATDSVIAVVKALRGREGPTRVLLTARSIGQWLVSITAGTGRDGVSAAEVLSVPLPRRHPASAGVFRRAAQRFAQLPGMSATTVDTPPDNPRWTTLDLVLQAWLAATGLSRDALPTKRDPLYDQILEREFQYWLRTCQKRKLPEYPLELFARAGAVLTLLAPTTRARATRALTAIEELAQPSLERATLIDVLTAMLTPDNPADGFAIRPDPVGERLVLPDPSHDERLTTQPNDPDAQAEAQASLVEGFRACTVLTRAAELDTPAATELTRRLLDHHPYLWPAGLSVAMNQGGPFATTLTKLAEQQDSPLPLAQLANDIPLGHASLRPLALIATQRTRPHPDPAAEEPDNLHTLAAWWNNLALRRGEVGDRAGALGAIDEAVTYYRRLAETNPAAFLPDLGAR